MGMTIDRIIKKLLWFEDYNEDTYCGGDRIQDEHGDWYYKVNEEDFEAFRKAADIMCKYQQLQADYEARLKENNELINDLEELRTMINKFAESYETRLKADMVAMLEELQAAIKEMSGLCTEIHGSEWNMKNVIDTREVLILLKQKIDKLKGAEDGNE